MSFHLFKSSDLVLKNKFKYFIKDKFLTCVLKRTLPNSLIIENNFSGILSTIKSKGKSIFTLNFDDLCPVNKTIFTLERGGNIDGSVAKLQEELLLRFPYIGITHFTIPNCTPSDFIRYFDKNKYRISTSENSEWLCYYKTLAEKYNIEFALHGYYHRQFINPFFSRHTELSNTTKEETSYILKLGKKCFEEAGFKTIGFRQPGWDFNSDFSLFDCLIDEGFQYAGLSSYNAGLNANQQRVSYDYPSLINDKLISFPDTVNLDWELERMIRRVDDLVAKKGCIVIKGHFVERKYMNAFSLSNYEKLCKLLDYMKNTFPNEIEYTTFEQAAKKIRLELGLS